MNKIKVVYEKKCKNIDESIMSITYPEDTIRKERFLFYRELKQHNILFGRFLSQESVHIQFNSPANLVFVTMNDEELGQLKEELPERTEYERCRLNDGIALLKLRTDIARSNPKYWEV